LISKSAVKSANVFIYNQQISGKDRNLRNTVWRYIDGKI